MIQLSLHTNFYHPVPQKQREKMAFSNHSWYCIVAGFKSLDGWYLNFRNKNRILESNNKVEIGLEFSTFCTYINKAYYKFVCFLIMFTVIHFQEFILCHEENNKDPRKCLQEGADVTACGMDFLRKLKKSCGNEFELHWRCIENRSSDLGPSRY